MRASRRTRWFYRAATIRCVPGQGVIDEGMRAYYEQRAAEYDDWWLGRGIFARRDRPGWHEEVAAVLDAVRALEPRRTLDVACGTAFVTRHLRGEVTGLDQSATMVQIAAARLPDGRAVQGDAVPLPFADASFDRVFTGHFYGHLPTVEREAFLREVRRVAGELVVVDSALRPGVPPEEWQERVLNDGSRHRVFKRYLTAAQLAAEIGGEVLLEGRWFVAARAATGPLSP
jgi:demethylmenaquinone methyltransferase/2-methoxy-6-polyprenyl-1,4-benzoquinol methylase